MSKSDSKVASQIRSNLLNFFERNGGGHFGSCLSSIDILYFIYSRYIYKKKSASLILSKGHCWAAYFSVLTYFDETLDVIDDPILYSMHPDHKSGLVEFTTGSLGHGISLGVGKAIANKLKTIFVLVGDGELNEGACWEGFMTASKYELSNLMIYVDRNNFQQNDLTEKVMPLEDLSKKLSSFGFACVVVDGHSLESLSLGMEEAKTYRKKPVVFICNTVKGKGIKSMENDNKYHYLDNLCRLDFKRFRGELEL